MKTKRFVLFVLTALSVIGAAGIVNAQGNAEQRHPGIVRRHRPIVTAVRNVIGIISDATNLPAREIVQQLAAGKTLADIVAENGSSVEAITATLMAQVNDRLAQAVENGRISQEQADEMAANMATRIDELLHRTFERLTERRTPRGRQRTQPKNEI